MDSKTIVMCVFALLLGMLLENMLKGVCGCKLTEGQSTSDCRSVACRHRLMQERNKDISDECGGNPTCIDEVMDAEDNETVSELKAYFHHSD